jgi:hypothetical protein
LNVRNLSLRCELGDGVYLYNRRRSTAHGTVRLPIRWLLGLTGNNVKPGFQVVADAVSGGSFISQEVRVFPGDEIKVYLTEHLLRSWITIRPQ